MMRQKEIAARFTTQRMSNIRQGSVLIFVIWILLVLTVLASSVAFRSRIHIQVSSMHDQEVTGLYDYLSAVNLASFFINEDEDILNDSNLEPWYGSPAEYQNFDLSKKITMTISDEESKLNLNKVTPEILQSFFKILEKNNIKLDTSADDLVGSIMAWRGMQSLQGKSTLSFDHKKAKFETVDELRLIQYITPRDYETIKPYFTVYGSMADFFLRININTAHEWLIEAVINSQPGGDLEKKDLLNRLHSIRKRNDRNASDEPLFAFQAADLTPQIFMDRLGLINTPQMVQLVNFSLRFFTVDSQYFRVELERKDDAKLLPRKVEVVIGAALPILLKQPRGQGFGLQNLMNDALRGFPYEILYWREGLSN